MSFILSRTPLFSKDWTWVLSHALHWFKVVCSWCVHEYSIVATNTRAISQKYSWLQLTLTISRNWLHHCIQSQHHPTKWRDILSSISVISSFALYFQFPVGLCVCVLESILLTLINLISQRGHKGSFLMLYYLGPFTSWCALPSPLLYDSILFHRRPVLCSIVFSLSQFTNGLPRNWYISRLLPFCKCCSCVHGNMYKRLGPLSVA